MIVDAPSPNFNDRDLPVSMLVLHYTGMKSAAAAIGWLTNPESRVSSHYLVNEDGAVVRMVDEAKRAWHAGASYWRGIRDINSASIGIEIVNPGHEFGYRPFPADQIAALIRLCSDIVKRHVIEPANVVGHSDIAPARKIDPGELFPWDKLAEYRLTPARPARLHTDPGWSDSAFLLALERYGYDIVDKPAAVRAFQRRWRPETIDGVIDGQCRAILWTLLLERASGAPNAGAKKGRP